MKKWEDAHRLRIVKIPVIPKGIIESIPSLWKSKEIFYGNTKQQF